jgi:hypothetical protein
MEGTQEKWYFNKYVIIRVFYSSVDRIDTPMHGSLPQGTWTQISERNKLLISQYTRGIAADCSYTAIRRQRWGRKILGALFDEERNEVYIIEYADSVKQEY